MGSGMKKVTLKDIAEVVGVSTPAVSAALNGTGRVSEKMREEITRTARQLGYRPNLAASLLKSKKISRVALVISDSLANVSGSGLFEPLMMEFISYCESGRIDYHIEVVDLNIDAEPFLRLVESGVVGGILHAGYVVEAVRDLQASGNALPLVTLDEPSLYCVEYSYRSGVRRAVECLVEQGHRRLVYVSGPHRFKSNGAQRDAFVEAAGEFGLGLTLERDIIELEISGDNSLAVRRSLAAFREVFSVESYPSAVICGGVRTARAAVFAAMERGLSVPDDVSVITTAAEWEATGSCPIFSAMERNSSLMIGQGMEVLQRLMSGGEREPEAIEVPVELVLRDTVGIYGGI